MTTMLRRRPIGGKAMQLKGSTSSYRRRVGAGRGDGADGRRRGRRCRPADLKEGEGNALAKELGAKVKCVRTDVPTRRARRPGSPPRWRRSAPCTASSTAQASSTARRSSARTAGDARRIRPRDQHQSRRHVQPDAPRRRGNDQERAERGGRARHDRRYRVGAAFDGQIGQAAYSASKAGVAG